MRVRNSGGPPPPGSARPVPEDTELSTTEIEPLFRVFLRTSSDVVGVAKPDGTIRFVSGAPDRAGFDPAFLIGGRGLDFVHPDDVRVALEALSEVMSGPDAVARFEIRTRPTKGASRHMEVTASNLMYDPSVAGIAFHARDVTDRREAEAALQASRHLFKAAFMDSVSGTAMIHTTNDRYVEVNDAMQKMLGYTRDELLEKTFLEVTHPDDRATGAKAREKLMSGHGVHLVKRYIHKSGRTIWAEVSIAVARDADGAARYFVTQSQDITERHMWDEERRIAYDEYVKIASELRSLLDNLPVGVLFRDSEGNCTQVNKTFLKVFGVERSDIIGASTAATARLMNLRRPDGEPLHGEDLPIDVLRRTQAPVQDAEQLATTQDGRELRIRVASTLVESGQGARGALAVIDDVTEQHQTQEQLRQAQKMEAVGRLAGGIAHDFNNLLAVIQNYAAFISESFEPGDERCEDVDEIRTACGRAAAMVQQLLAFSRKEQVRSQIIDLGETVSGMERLLRGALGENVELRISKSHARQTVRGNSGQMEQVLLNLVINARDAMPRGGRLTIDVSSMFVSAAEADHRPGLARGRYVTMTVADTGEGMDDETRAKAFDPFFTTKAGGQGTGLGLATVYGIVQQAGGHIDIRSQLTVGSTFTVFLPAVDQEPDPIADPRPMRPQQHGRGTILVAEDEDAVRRVIERILSRAGYEVLLAASGEEALDVFYERNGEIDVLVSDVIMQKMTGRDLASRILEISTRPRVIYVSGYTDEILGADGVAPGSGFDYLSKPFSSEALLDKVRTAVDSI